jgi:hypothetical protein
MVIQICARSPGAMRKKGAHQATISGMILSFMTDDDHASRIAFDASRPR